MQKYWQKKNNILQMLLYYMINKYRQLFVVIDITEAKERGFKFIENVWGDKIIKLNCRSIWKDKKNRNWRVKELKLR